MKEKTAKQKRKYIVILIVIVLLIVLAALGYWKRRGIRNTVYRMLGIPIPKQTTVYGYYDTEIKVDTDLAQTVTFQTDDGGERQIATNAEEEDSLVAVTYDIDGQITQELAAGQYTFEDPLVLSNPYQISPLTGVIVFTTQEPCRVRVTVKGKTQEADITGETVYDTDHRVPVIGLYPGEENTVELTLLDEDGQPFDETQLSMKTDHLPDEFDGMVEAVETQGTSAYGMTVVSGQSVKYPFAYDLNGDIRWYLNRKSASYGVFPLSDNRMIFQDADGYISSCSKTYSTVMYEMDYLGRTYQMYFVPEGTHHEIIEKEPGGNLLILSNSLEEHIEDKVIEYDRQTGEVVNSLEMGELFGDTFDTKIDWAHLNTVSYNADDDTILISPRNMHSAVKLNWTTHEIVWILCNPKFYEDTEYEQYVLTPEGDFMWHYQQHSVYEIEEDLDNDPDTIQISMFDNHTQHQSKVSFFEESDYSYLTVYAVNESERTVSLLSKIPVVLSKVTSNTVYDAASGHIFGMCGSVEEDDKTGMIYEFDYESEELLNQYFIGKKFYRAFEMTMDYEALSSPMEIRDTSIVGTLRTVVETKKRVKTPKQTLSEGISFRLISDLLFVDVQNHSASQIILKGEEKSYVYDLNAVSLYEEDYLSVSLSTPIPLFDLTEGHYDIYCVYEDEYYDTGIYVEIG